METSASNAAAPGRMDVLPDLFIVPELAPPRVTVRFTPPPGCSSCTWEIADGDGRTVAGGTERILEGAPAEFGVDMPGCRPWTVETPHLYALRMRLAGVGGETAVAETFGMRTIAAVGREVHVNGRPFLVRGTIRGREAHEHPNLADLPEEEFFAKSFRAAKAYGFNLVRFHSRVPSEGCFAAADRLGMFIHVEYRTYFGLYQKERELLDDTDQLIDLDGWREMILRLRNHPSLMVYCIGNEIRHPGTNPAVERIADITHRLDPTRLFIDTCAHGEFDRTYVDIDVQHMGYFYPFGRHADMFENTQNWLIFGSCTGLAMTDPAGDAEADAPYRLSRSIQPDRPVLAHEICHYAGLRDLDALDAKFRDSGAPRPWWIDELRKLLDAKGLSGDYARMLAASKRFQMVNWKLGIEAARRSAILAGFHFLQLADTDRYENSNGILDCFDDPVGVDPDEFLRFNGETVLLADLPRRTFFEGEWLTVPILLSHYSCRIAGQATLAFRLSGSGVAVSGQLGGIDLDHRGRREIGRLHLKLPETPSPRALTLTVSLAADAGPIVANSWRLWLYPNRPAEVAFPPCKAVLDGINLALRYPQLAQAGPADAPGPESLLIANRFSEAVLEHLAAGGDVLMLYRAAETRSRRFPAEPETLYLPATWDRFKGVIWDRGTNLGAFIRDSAALAGFPHDGFLDLQFHGLVDDCDKIVLDDFPCPVTPIIQGVDKASRDRFDVHTFGLRELQPEWTMRKFAYLFEVRVGGGRMLVSGMNFTGLNTGCPEACAMFESLLAYVAGDGFQPAARIPVEALRDYLRAKAAAPRIRERMMTQYWQLDDAPLESARYWKEAEAWIRR
ncbi:MAG TPA: glycoside hydrolase family 2 TIM barrel-domain containing protein [Phycisphaerae bacterium]|nr:glycoside hydrolase family 2 TIM barrel-domain containing protein [Phycisphaerae bacterium]